MAKALFKNTDSTVDMNGEEMARALAKRVRKQRPWLVVVSGPTSVGKMFSLESPLTLGRASDCDVSLDEDGISRLHARFGRRDDGTVYLQDLESKNGTYVNGERVETHVLRDGDKIQVGPISILKFSYQDVLDEALQRNLYESATKDPLTRVANKRALDDTLEREFAYARRHRTPLAVVMLDIDHFKRINDTFGHAAGDGVLRAMAQLVERSTRAEDFFARVGGEEFALVLRGLDERNAALFAERVRQLVVSSVFMEGETRVPVTISLGLACHAPGQTTPEDLLRAADENLYRAKRDGRNRVATPPRPAQT
jgi:diguanylate cyclase (GGDEF)-like protein